jgi:hypothetical protein
MLKPMLGLSFAGGEANQMFYLDTEGVEGLPKSRAFWSQKPDNVHYHPSFASSSSR